MAPLIEKVKVSDEHGELVVNIVPGDSRKQIEFSVGLAECILNPFTLCYII